MKESYYRRILAAAIVIAFMLSFAMPALAADYVETTQSSQVYPTASSSIPIGVLPSGVVAEKLGTSGSWTKIVFGNSYGYILTSNTKYSSGASSATSSTSTATTSATANMYATGSVNVRSGPSTKYSILGKLAKNDTVVCTGDTSGWYIIDWNGTKAYVHGSFLKPLGTASSSMVMATAAVNIRSGPGTKYSIIGGLNKNQTIQKTGTSGKWTKVNLNGTTGYISSAYLTAATSTVTTTSTTTNTTTTTSASTTLYAIRTTAIRTGPGTGYSKVGELSPEDTIQYAGSISGTWYKVVFGSYDAYVYGYDVEFRDGTYYSGSSETVYATTKTPVYSSTSTSSTLLGYLYAGDPVSTYGSSSSTWTGIWYNGQLGYTYSSNLEYNSSNFYSSNYIGEYWYSTSNNVRCYSSASTSSNYLGYLNYGERVWVRYANSSWAECTINGKTMYVRVSDLSDSNYYSNNYNSGYYTAAKDIEVFNSSGARTGISVLSGTSFYVESSRNSYGLVEISWYDSTDKRDRSGYIYYSDLP